MYKKDIAQELSQLSDPQFLNSDEKIILPDSYSNRIIKCIQFLANHNQEGLAKKELNSILEKPSVENGTVYEVLAYQWFHAMGLDIDYQPEIINGNAFKANGSYAADGKLDGEVVFDIKSYSFGQPRYAELQSALNEMWQKQRNDSEGKIGELPDYYIIISGNSDLSSKMMENLLNQKKKLLKDLFSDNSRVSRDYIIYIKEFGIEIRAHYNQPGKVNVHTGVSEANVDKWAKNNETQVIMHGSQFCRSNPYFLFYPYDRHKARHYYWDDQKQFDVFKTLMRRSFINLQKNERFLNGYDGKAGKDIRVCEAIHKLSGVFFLDVTNDYEYGKNNAMFFINPNADNPLRGYQVDCFFRTNGVTVYDFYYDNY